MAYKSTLTPDLALPEALAWIKRNAEGSWPSWAKPSKLKVSEVRSIVSVFQPRKLDGRLAEDEAHIKALMDAIGNPDKPRLLDPIVVWNAGKIGWCVIDGHHRLEAYRRHKLFDLDVPVTVFDGSLSEAMAHSAAQNSKNKLAMTQAEKLDMAWRLVLTSDLSKANIADACKVSIRTVSNMRSKKREAEGKIEWQELAKRSWKSLAGRSIDEILGAKTRDPLTDDELEAKLQGTAEAWAKRLCKTLGSQMIKNPESFARALKIIENKLPVMLMESQAWEDDLAYLAEAFDDEEDDEGEDGFDQGEPELEADHPSC